MNFFFNRLFAVCAVFLGFLALAGSVSAEETAPIFTSNFVTTYIEQEKTLDITITASGGANTKIGCYDCTVIKVTDNGDGTARVFWDTKNPLAQVGGPYTINVFAANKKDETKITWGVLSFMISAPSTAEIKWEPSLSQILANYGSIFDVTLKATGGADTQIICGNCTLVTVTDNGDGTAKVYWDTSKVAGLVPGPYYISLTAKSKTKPDSKIEGVLELYVQPPAAAEGAPQWTSSINNVTLKAGDVSVQTISATGGSETAFDCPSCAEAVLQDKGDGTAVLTWDTSKNKSLGSGTYVVNVRAFVKADPVKANLRQITYIYLADSAGSGSPTGTPNIPSPYSSQTTAESLKEKYGRPKGYTGPIPDCAFSGTCRSTSDLVILLINIAKFLFSIIGVVAFVAFVYGGFMMIFSFGSSDKVTQGKDAMVAAVVGLVIAFGAYMIINFILGALDVQDAFRGVIN